MEKIPKPDVSIAQNYLKETEPEDTGPIVNSFLDLAEDMAKRHIPLFSPKNLRNFVKGVVTSVRK